MVVSWTLSANPNRECLREQNTWASLVLRIPLLERFEREGKTQPET